jgi:nifR3 family TIM-barrel protein
MEDVTDTVYRRLVGKCGRPDVFYTEFTSTDGLFSVGREKVIHRLQFTEEERPIVAQIWGTKPENFFRASQLLAEMGFDGIDLNMGCPVPKIVKNGACSALIENPSLAKEIFLASVEGAGEIPVSVKTRLGFNDFRTESWSTFVLELKPPALIMHGRIAKHMSSRPASWEEIARVVEIKNDISPETVVVGNGDVKSFAEVVDKVETTGVDGVMVGRGIFENLFLFRPEGVAQRDLPLEEKMALLTQHIDLFERTWEGVRPFRALKKFFKNYASGFRGASELRMQLVETESYEEVREVIERWIRDWNVRETDDLRAQGSEQKDATFETGSGV